MGKGRKYVRNELTYRLNHMSSNYKKRYYFLWRNGLSTLRVDYSKFTEQEFIDKFMNGSQETFNYYKHWALSEEYADLMQLLLHQNMNADFVDIYKAVRDKAVKGDDKAVKTFLLLQKELNNKFKNFGNDDKEKQDQENDDIDEDDGLTLE